MVFTGSRHISGHDLCLHYMHIHTCGCNWTWLWLLFAPFVVTVQINTGVNLMLCVPLYLRLIFCRDENIPNYSAEHILRILLNPNIDVRPTNKSLRHLHLWQMLQILTILTTLRTFVNGTHSGSHIVPFHTSIFKDGYGYIDVEKCALGASGSNVYYLRRLQCTFFKQLLLTSQL